MDDSSTILSWLTFLPLVGALIVAGLGRVSSDLIRGVARAIGFVCLFVTVLIWLRFDVASGAIQLEQKFSWIPSLKVFYHLGIDGLGLAMVGLTSVVMLMAIWSSPKDSGHVYFALMLFLQSGLYGAFTALNFFHWFLYWELCLIPAFFLIKFYGGLDRTPAAMQFFVYTMVGSIALLVGFMGLYIATGSFDFIELAGMAKAGEIVSAVGANLHWAGLKAETVYQILAIGVLLGFAVKVPLVPFHTWLPQTYTQAPTSVTMVLTGVMSKLGLYGLLRLFLPIFPDAIRAMMTPLLILAVITVVLAAGAALAQRDIKRIFAYSSVNHLGYCLLGIFVVAAGSSVSGADKAAVLNGVILQMFNHGITAAALFCFLGYLENRSGGLRGLDDFGGLRKIAPVFCGLMGVSLFASLGLPGLNGFVGEFLIFKGVFAISAWAAVLALPGLLITAVFILTLLQKVFSGPLNTRWESMADLSTEERAIILPATVLMFVLGLFPSLLVQFINPTVIRILGGLN